MDQARLRDNATKYALWVHRLLLALADQDHVECSLYIRKLAAEGITLEVGDIRSDELEAGVELLNDKEAAAFMGCSLNSIQGAVERGAFQGVYCQAPMMLQGKPGSRRLWRKDRLLAWLYADSNRPSD